MSTNSIAMEPSSSDESKDVTGNDASIELNGHLPVVCAITDQEHTDIDFEHRVANREMFFTTVGLKCNNKAGATATVITGDGLQIAGDPDGDHALEYNVWWTIPGADRDADARAGRRNVHSATVASSKELAEGVTTNIKIQIREDPIFAGDYVDSFQLVISAI